MIEKVAKAIAYRVVTGTELSADEYWDNIGDVSKEQYTLDAKAAIEAMRDPDALMEQVTADWGLFLDKVDFEAYWFDRIDAALKSANKRPTMGEE
ncbi:MAG: hypothetical protein COB09_16940 [Thalassobium sp.]|nr:MAG: hypothetical protein COB09_16940 [Thalassobium sp.]